jgi:hypothetical protein
MIMDKYYVNEAALQLIDSFQKFNQTVVESASATQAQQWQVLQSLFEDWIEMVKEQTQTNSALVEELDQLTLKQLEGFQRRASEAAKSSFALLSAPLSTFPPSLQLNENLQICLLALATRYPQHLVDINEAVLGSQPFRAQGWRAADLIEWLKSTAPELLQATARLEVNSQRRGIYLLERSEETPAFWIHCGEKGKKMPPYRGNLATRRQEQVQTPEEASETHHPARPLQTAM